MQLQTIIHTIVLAAVQLPKSGKRSVICQNTFINKIFCVSTLRAACVCGVGQECALHYDNHARVYRQMRAVDFTRAIYVFSLLPQHK